MNTAGYPYDIGNASTMVHEYTPNTFVTPFLLCTQADTCSGQSGSGIWFYFTASGDSTAAGTLSGYGGDCASGGVSIARFTRITEAVATWMRSSFADCSCTSGACCDGCSLRPPSYICDGNADVEYRCSGAECGANAQQRALVRHCSGDSTACTGATELLPWSNVESCAADDLCQTDGRTYARCMGCSAGCSNGTCCECDSGPCCDGCRFKPPSEVCDDRVAVEYRCEGDACGGTPQQRVQRRFCSGTRSACDGNATAGDWQSTSSCSGQLCETDLTSFATCRPCELGCVEGRCTDPILADGGSADPGHADGGSAHAQPDMPSVSAGSGCSCAVQSQAISSWLLSVAALALARRRRPTPACLGGRPHRPRGRAARGPRG